jgi:hypothetical protein
MEHFGVKLNNGKIMWVRAEEVAVRDGAVIFFRDQTIIAGFSLSQVNHFGRPEAFGGEDHDPYETPGVVGDEG